MERIVSTWFWRQYTDEGLREWAQACRARVEDPSVDGFAREMAVQLADEMGAELARRAMEETSA